MFKKFAVIPVFILFAVIVIHNPEATSEPAANPLDPAREDLARVEYPSQESIPWYPHFIRPNETLESLFGDDWVLVARFNRIDRRHTYPGMTLKVPRYMEDIRHYTPVPRFYEPAKRYEKYILVDLTEQWIGAYEYGKLKLSMPAATGSRGHETPTGLFRVDARHRWHTSSLYKTEDETGQYPMDNAFRFHIGEDDVSYWIHARDLPGRPASHGCIGVYDEEMQNRVYGIPHKPVLKDSHQLYDWAVGENDYEDDTGELEELEDGPVVEIKGSNPRYLPAMTASAR
ncbi:L,D-transpeptidase [Geobacter sp. DSM 9736]|uniref:L,D-transpeptidase n=1 Tax=Geobacter sp. DSM 9736 TaxID=1277350 RepID=UPI000B50C7F3|nr:L,D-transpeptidase [Geobacter sp. DSM 9736]SNB45574.1 L,D-transpeptidase catalytic domain [Geobacter sp. DSM 9736]